jgi:P-type Cu+ transporter
LSSELSSIRLPVEGMSCAACANRIEKRLSKLNGVESVHVHLGMDEAHIVYDPK